MHRHSFRMNHSMHWIRRIDSRDISNEIVKLLRFQLLGFWFNGFFMSYNFNKSSLFISCGFVIVLDGVLRNIFFYLRDVLSYLWILSWNKLVGTWNLSEIFHLKSNWSENVKPLYNSKFVWKKKQPYQKKIENNDIIISKFYVKTLKAQAHAQSINNLVFLLDL